MLWARAQSRDEVDSPPGATDTEDAQPRQFIIRHCGLAGYNGSRRMSEENPRSLPGDRLTNELKIPPSGTELSNVLRRPRDILITLEHFNQASEESLESVRYHRSNISHSASDIYESQTAIPITNRSPHSDRGDIGDDNKTSRMVPAPPRIVKGTKEVTSVQPAQITHSPTGYSGSRRVRDPGALSG